MNDDELRDRLRAMPEPTISIDVDAVVADARRRRRPKVVGVAVASVAGCLALLAPVVVPGLVGPDPVTATLQDSGAAEQAPAAPAPGDGTDAPDAPASAQPEALSAPVAACTAAPVDDDLAILFTTDDDGTGTLGLQNLSDAPVDLVVGDVGVGATTDGVLVLAPDVDVASVASGTPVTLQPFESVELDVSMLPATSACGGGAPSGDGEVMTVETVVVALSIDGATPAVPVLGTIRAR